MLWTSERTEKEHVEDINEEFYKTYVQQGLRQVWVYQGQGPTVAFTSYIYICMCVTVLEVWFSFKSRVRVDGFWPANEVIEQLNHQHRI